MASILPIGSLTAESSVPPRGEERLPPASLNSLLVRGAAATPHSPVPADVPPGPLPPRGHTCSAANHRWILDPERPSESGSMRGVGWGVCVRACACACAHASCVGTGCGSSSLFFGAPAAAGEAPWPPLMSDDCGHHPGSRGTRRQSLSLSPPVPGHSSDSARGGQSREGRECEAGRQRWGRGT